MEFICDMDKHWASRGAERFGPMVYARWRRMIEWHLGIKDKKLQRRIFDVCVHRGYFTRQKMPRFSLWFYTYVSPLLERKPISAQEPEQEEQAAEPLSAQQTRQTLSPNYQGLFCQDSGFESGTTE
jgi:hypothetical protein